MAWILRNSGYEERDGSLEGVAAPQNTNVYLEAVEEAENEVDKPIEVRNAEWQANRNGNTRKGYWAIAGSGILTHAITNERLARRGYYDISEAYKSMHGV